MSRVCDAVKGAFSSSDHFADANAKIVDSQNASDEVKHHAIDANAAVANNTITTVCVTLGTLALVSLAAVLGCRRIHTRA